MVCGRCVENGVRLLGFEIGGQRRVGVAQGDGYGLGVEFGALGAGVGVVDGEEERGLLLAGGFEAVGFDGGHVDKATCWSAANCLSSAS